MATDRTTAGAALAAFGVPYKISAVASALSIDYDVADLRAGPVTQSAASPTRMEASGEPTTVQNQTLKVKVVRAGRPTAASDGGGIAYARYIGAGPGTDWYARERPSLLTGWQRVSLEAGSYPSAVALSDGTVVAGWDVAGGSPSYSVAVRSAAGVWSATTTLVSAAVVECGCLTAAPDGAIHAYVLATPVSGSTDAEVRCYRSTDGGTTWALQRSSCTEDSFPSASTYNIRAVSDGSGGVALFVSVVNSTSSTCKHYASGDGGFSFVPVTGAASRSLCWDAQRIDGVIHLLTCEEIDAGANDAYFHRSAATAFDAAFTGARTQVSADGEFSYSIGGCLSSLYPGVFWATYYAGSQDFVSKRTEDGGSTWLTRQRGPELEDADVTGQNITTPCAVSQRGTILLVAPGNGDMCELAYGGNTNYTFGQDVLRMQETTFVPTQTIANTGWTNTDTGAVTRTTSTATGETIDCSAGGPAVSIFTGTTSDAGVFYVCARGVYPPAVGTRCSVLASVTDSTHGVIVEIAETATDVEIRAYGVGAAAPSFTTTAGSVGDYVEVMIAVDGTEGRVYYRIRNNSFERQWADYGSVTAGAVDATYIANTARIEVGATDVGAVLFMWPEWVATPTIHNGMTRPNELFPIPLTSSPTYLTDGVSVRLAGGTVVADGVTHTIGYDSPYRVENVLWQRSPSPRVPWRTDSTANQIVDLTLYEDGDAPLLGVYLAGLKWIEQVNVRTDGATATTATIGISYPYAAAGTNSITLRKVASGSGGVNQRWVQADSLVGWGVELADGTCRTIVGNSDGLLLSQTGTRAPAAVLHLDGAHDTPGGSATATLLPTEAMVVIEGATGIDSVGVQILAANNPTPADGYREVGIIVPLRMHVLGYPPDLSDEWTTAGNAGLITEPGGARHVARRSPDRRGTRIAYMASVHEVRAVEGVTSDPDYVTAPYADTPVAPHTAIPYVLEGIVRRAAGLPVLWCPSLVLSDAGAATVVTNSTTHTGRPMWCRIIGGISYEGVQYVGTRGVSQVFRVPAITMEEEL